MATPRAATTRPCHTELFSRILTNQYLPHPYLLRGERVGVGKKGFKGTLQASLVLSKWLNCSKQMQASNWLVVLPGTPAKLAWLTQATQVK